MTKPQHPELVPSSSNYEYIGDVTALGSLNLTMLARSYEQIEVGSLDDIFPSQDIPERTITIEQMLEGLGIMPIVRFGVPAGNFTENERIRRRQVSPAIVRMDDFLDQGLINQLRRAGTYNEQYRPEQIVADRVRKMINYHKRTMDFFRAQVLLGRINYTDPRTRQSIDVSTHIPTHNLFSYDGYSETLAANAAVPGTNYTAAKALINDKGRKEAILFADAQNRVGVPWTHPQADIVRCLRFIKHFLWKTNKNQFTEMVMSSELYTVLMENEYVKAYSGQLGLFGNYPMTGGTGDGGRQLTVSGVGAQASPQFISYGPGGDIQAIAGVRIRVLDGLFRHPQTNEITNYWPANKVALIAPRHYLDASETLGLTHHCVAESPDGSPGLWMRTGPDQQPPSPPGRTMQMGDSFLPFAKYPEWISILTVCEPEELSDTLVIKSMEGYGTF
jgi:hypothetical protein